MESELEKKEADAIMAARLGAAATFIAGSLAALVSSKYITGNKRRKYDRRTSNSINMGYANKVSILSYNTSSLYRNYKTSEYPH